MNVELLKGSFVDTDKVAVADWDGGEHTFDVIVTPGTDIPSVGDTAWIVEDTDGEYPVVCWRPA